jgi:hypothetical protein
MKIFDAIMNIECNDDCSEELYIESFQTLIDTGIVWQLQGCYGRTAAALIEAGLCQKR